MPTADDLPYSPPLIVAASLAALEGWCSLVACSRWSSQTTGRVTMGVTTAGFLRGVRRRLAVLRLALTRGPLGASPVVLAQLIQLGLAWSFRGGDTLGRDRARRGGPGRAGRRAAPASTRHSSAEPLSVQVATGRGTRRRPEARPR